jgi:hypothetical protein
MNNLFVCHSQAQLILAIGLAKGRFINQENHLILFKDFQISEELEIILKHNFKKTLFRIGIYPDSNKKWLSKIISIPKDILAINNFIAVQYKRVFVVCDGNIQEMQILKKTKQINANIEMIWLEDGSYPYFINTIKKDGLNANIYLQNFRKFIFKNIFFLGDFYSFEGDYMSGNKNLKKAYLTLPGLERTIFNSKVIIAIDSYEYKLGMQILFPINKFQINNNSIIVVLDKLDTYIYIDQIIRILEEIIKFCEQNNYAFYYKLHPRENQNLDILLNKNEILQNIAIESIYINNLLINMTVIGIKSTSLQSAKFLGFKTISCAYLASDNNHNLLNFYAKLNISLPKNNEELRSILI